MRHDKNVDALVVCSTQAIVAEQQLFHSAIGGALLTSEGVHHSAIQEAWAKEKEGTWAHVYTACDSRIEPNPRPLTCVRDGITTHNATAVHTPDVSLYPCSGDVEARAAAVATGARKPQGFQCFARDFADNVCKAQVQFGMKWCMRCHAVITFQSWEFEPASEAGDDEEPEEVQATTVEGEEGDGGSGSAGAADASGGLAAAGEGQPDDEAMAALRERIEQQAEELVAAAMARAIRDGPTFDATANTFTFRERVQSEWRALQNMIRQIRRWRVDFNDPGPAGEKARTKANRIGASSLLHFFQPIRS